MGEREGGGWGVLKKIGASWAQQLQLTLTRGKLLPLNEIFRFRRPIAILRWPSITAALAILSGLFLHFLNKCHFSETSSSCLHAWQLLVQKWSTHCKIHLNSAPPGYNENLFTDTLVTTGVLVNPVCAQWELLHVTKSGVVLSTHKVRCRTRCRSEQTKTRLQLFKNQYVWHKTWRHHA